MKFLRKLSIFLMCFLFIKPVVAGNEAIHYMNKKKWKEAEQIARKSKNTALINLVVSQKFLDSNYSNNFEEIVEFAKKNPDWPGIDEIAKKAERYINNCTNKNIIVKWFHKNKPKTANGYKFYAYSAATELKDSYKLKDILREGWIYGDFTDEEQKKYLAKYGKYLTEEDHVKRLDEHLWKCRFEEVKRSLYLVSKNYKDAFNASIALLQKKPNAMDLFKSIPEKYLTNSMIYHYLVLQKYHDPNKYLLSMMQKVKPDSKHSEEWTKIQIYWTREFLYDKDYVSAYKAISTSFPVELDDIRDVSWHAGWIALRFLKNPDLAERHFYDFLKVVKTPISVSRGYYWLGKCYDRNHNHNKALEFYKKASEFSYTFYGQIAKLQLKDFNITLPSHPKISEFHRSEVENNAIVKAAKLLLADNKVELAKNYLKKAMEMANSKAEIALLVKIIADSHNTYHTVSIAKIASHNNVFLKEYLFPVPYKIANNPIEAAFTYGIIRQESVFDSKAVSNRDAMGLMQIIKGTACPTAKSLSMQCDVSKLTKDYKYNIKLGSNHIKDLLKKTDGYYVLSIAYYNTAPKNVNKWIKLFGDPRKMTKLDDVIDWIELIPFAETRNYVHRVLENIQVYRVILNKNNNLKLKQDLMHL